MRRAAADLTVGFLLADHFTLTALSTFVDALRLAADEGDRSRPMRCDWVVMAPQRQPVRASCGIEVTPQAELRDPAGLDYLVVVGGLLHRGPQICAARRAYLHRAAAAGVPLVGLCTGSFVLAREGLMRGRRCCVSWFHYHDFVAEFGTQPVADHLYLIDGDRITCSGGAGAADLAAALIAHHLDRGAARKSLDILLVDRARAPTAAQPRAPGDIEALDERVHRALLVMEQHLAEPLAVAEIARRIGSGGRQLQRLFRDTMGKGPAEIYRTIRLRHGRWFLSHTDRTVAMIAADTGFADAAHFARCFRREFGVAPSGLRHSPPPDPPPPYAGSLEPAAGRPLGRRGREAGGRAPSPSPLVGEGRDGGEQAARTFWSSDR